MTAEIGAFMGLEPTMLLAVMLFLVVSAMASIFFARFGTELLVHEGEPLRQEARVVHHDLYLHRDCLRGLLWRLALHEDAAVFQDGAADGSSNFAGSEAVPRHEAAEAVDQLYVRIKNPQ